MDRLNGESPRARIAWTAEDGTTGSVAVDPAVVVGRATGESFAGFVPGTSTPATIRVLAGGNLPSGPPSAKGIPPRAAGAPPRAPAGSDIVGAVLGRWLSDGTLAGLTAREQAVLVAMVVRSRPGRRGDPMRVRISAGRLAESLGTGRATVQRAIASLARRGLVVLVARGGSVAGPSTYQIPKPWR